MWGSLGDIVFQLVKTPNKLRASKHYRLPVLTPVKGTPFVQYTGDEPQEVELSILFHYSFCNPEGEIEKLKNLKGLKLPLVIGSQKWGDFAIEELRVEVRETTKGGELLSAEVSLKLKEVPNVGA
jgi:phage protein U